MVKLQTTVYVKVFSFKLTEQRYQLQSVFITGEGMSAFRITCSWAELK